MQNKELLQKKYFQLITTGHYIDVQNADAQWVLARVLEKDKKYLWVAFDGQNKKQQQFFINSYRVAPLRTHTEGFTGSYIKIHRNNMPRVEDLKNYIEIAQQKFFNQKAKAFQITQLLRGQLFVYIHDLLCRQSILNEKQVEHANEFIELFMSFTYNLIIKAIEYQQEYFASPLASNKSLYLTNPKIALIQSLQQILILLQLIVKADAFKYVNLWKYNKNIVNQDKLIEDFLKNKWLNKLFQILIVNDKKGQWYPTSTRKSIYKILLKYSLAKSTIIMPQMPKYLVRDFQEFYSILPFMWRCQPTIELQNQYVDFSINILLTSSPFDAKLKSIQQLRKIFEGKSKFQFLDQKKVLTKIDQMGVLEQLLDNKNFNPQVFKRFVPILSVLCKIRNLSLKNIQSLFQQICPNLRIVKFRHQSETGIIFDIISEISEFAPSSLLDNVYTEICKIDINSQQTMKFIKTFTIKAVQNLSKEKSILSGFFGRKKGGSSKYGYYGLNILYKESHDDGRISKQKILFALNIIKELLTQNTLKDQRWNHMNSCVDFIKTKKNFGQSIKLISLILSTFDEASYFGQDRKKVIEKIQSKSDLIQLIVLGFKNIENIPQIKFTHEQCYQHFYDLIEIISPYVKVPLTINQIEFLWYKCDSVALLNFLRKPRPNQKFKKLLPPELIELIFTVIFKKPSFYKRNLTYQEFETIHQLFVSYHLDKGNLVMNSKDSLIRYNRPNLLGIDYFINFLEHSKDEQSFQKATQKTIEIVLRPSSKRDNVIVESNIQLKVVTWKDLFKSCIQRLLTTPKKCLTFIQLFYLLIEGRFVKEIKTDDTNNVQILVQMGSIQKKVVIERFATIFKLRKLIKEKFRMDCDFEMFNIKMNKVINFDEEEDYSINAMPLMDGGRSVSIEVQRKSNKYHQQQEACLRFKKDISNEEKLYDMIFKIIEQKDLSPQIQQMFWITIELLPLNKSMMAEIQKCDAFSLEKWLNYFEATSDSSLQYKLSIVLSLIRHNSKWVLKMEQNHGLLALALTLIKTLQKWNYLIQNQPLIVKVLDIILQVYQRCPSKTLQNDIIKEINQNIIRTLEAQVNKNSQQQKKKILISMNLINKFMSIYSSNVQILNQTSQKQIQKLNLKTCMDILEFGMFARKTQHSIKFVQLIARNIGIAVNSKQDYKQILDFMITHLNVEKLLVKERTETYFRFILIIFNQFQGHTNQKVQGKEINQPSTLIQQIIPSLQKMVSFIHEVLQSQFLNDDDKTHQSLHFGTFNITKLLLKKATQGFQLNEKLIFDGLIQSFLFPSNQSCFKRLKSQRNKKFLFEIIKQISFKTPQTLSVMTQKLTPFLQRSKFRKNSILNWNLHFENSEKKIYVGLQNLGATCYINCLFQQLFMIQSFRESFMSIESQPFKPELDKNQIYQLQKIFYSLKYGQRKAQTTKNFCASFITFEGQPISPVVQSDADEFFNTLMDRIQTFLKLTSHHDILEKTFQGQLSNQLNCEGCPHRSEKIQPFMSIGVNLKNKKTLEEALKGYVEGQILDGDNAYYCQPCDKKVRTLKRLCIKQLPNILVIVLKRFEYDFDTYKKIKINSYLEFPEKLDMTEYTSEFLQSKSMEKLAYYNKEQSETLASNNRQKNTFHLRGTVIHAGYADAGHYYSFIKNNDKWFEFNDEFIREINYAKIQQEGFGGEDKDSPDELKVEKYKNAYILFYEKETPQNLPQTQNQKITLIKEGNQNIISNQTVSFYENMKDQVLSQNYETSIFSALMDQNFINFWQNLSILDNLFIKKFIFLYFHTVVMRDKQKYEYATNFFRILIRYLSSKQINEKDKNNETKLINQEDKNNQIAQWFVNQINKAYIKEFLIQAPKSVKFVFTSLLLTAINHAQQIPQELLLSLISSLRKTGMSPFGQVLKRLLKRKQVEVKLRQLKFYEILTDLLFNEKKVSEIPQPQIQVEKFFGTDCSESEIQRQKCSVALLDCLENYQGLTIEMILKLNESYSFRRTNKVLLRRLSQHICIGIENSEKNESDVIGFIKMFEERVFSTNRGKQFVEKYLFFIRYLVWESENIKQSAQIHDFIVISAQNFILSYARNYEPMDWIIRQLSKIASKSVKFRQAWKSKIQQNSNLKLQIETWLRQIDKPQYINMKDDFFQKIRIMDIHDKSEYLKSYSKRMRQITAWIFEPLSKSTQEEFDVEESDLEQVEESQIIRVRNKAFIIKEKFDQGILFMASSPQKQSEYLWIYLEKNEIQTFNNL